MTVPQQYPVSKKGWLLVATNLLLSGIATDPGVNKVTLFSRDQEGRNFAELSDATMGTGE